MNGGIGKQNMAPAPQTSAAASHHSSANVAEPRFGVRRILDEGDRR